MSDPQPLRPYQKKAVEVERRESSVVLVSPTGSGKTRILIDVCKDGKKTLVLVPWRFLVDQTAGFFNAVGVPCGILHGHRAPDGESVVVTTTATAARRGKDLADKIGFTPERLAIDEAHGVAAPQARKVVSLFPKARKLGLTATPERLDRKPLGDVFRKLHVVVTVDELIRQGFLVPTEVYGPPDGVDLKGVRVSAGDYVPKEAAIHMGQPRLLGHAADEWRRRAGKGHPTWIYCCSIPHAEAVARAWSRAGYPTEVMCGATRKAERTEQLERLERGELAALTNVQVLTEGVDFPPLRAIVLLRPTLSKALHLQIIGRGLRPHPGKKKCVVLDHAGNHRRHGFAEDDREWTLRPKKRRTRGEIEGAVMTFECPFCEKLIPINANPCPHCKRARLPEVLNGRLERQESKTHGQTRKGERLIAY